MVFGTGLLTPDVQVCADGLLDELDVHPHPARLWCSLVVLLLCSARWTRARPSNSAPTFAAIKYITLPLSSGFDWLQLLGSKLMADAVPTAWSKQWEGPEDSRKWLRAIVSKRVALTQWAAKVRVRLCLTVPILSVSHSAGDRVAPSMA